MRTLVLTQVVPYPGDAGPKIKTHFAIRTLAQDHDVELLSYTRSAEESAAAQAMRAWCTRVTTVPLLRKRVLEPYYAARGWATLTPFLVVRDARRDFARAVRERLALGNIDVLHADQLSMAQYLPLARAAGIRTVFDAHNAVWELVRDLAPRQPTALHRTASAVEWRFLRRFEGAAARESDLTLAVSDRDRDALTAAAGCPITSAVVPIGIEARNRALLPPNQHAQRVLSVGTMHYPPNAEALRWFRDGVWPQVQSQIPTARLDVAGHRPPNDLLAWGNSDDSVSVHGYVTDEQLEQLYRDAAVLVVPLRAGSGVRVKILEAMALGVPVVSTTVGIDGLDVTPGEHVLVADEPAEFAAAVVALVQSPELRVALVRAARARVLERYDWRNCCRPLLDAYRMLEGGRKKAAFVQLSGYRHA